MPTFISLPLKHFVSALLLGLPLTAAAQLPSPAGVPDSLPVTARPSTLRRATYWAGQPANQRVLIPAILFTAGALTTRRVAVVNSDNEVREELNEHVVPVRTTIDDELRHVPAAVALGLSLAGVKGQHSTVNQALLFALTYTINNTLTSNLKNLTRVERPGNNGDFSSFPSQHTSAAFSAARFLDREYGESSNWYRVGGYSVATGVAALRLIKGNHWLSDVLAGAGVGLASTELAYWIYPRVQRVLVKGLQDQALVLPFYQAGAAGLTAVVVLR
ncbi:phosphatase PAP2 family protein [Hymenobacter sp. DH14]|uniref:Phosphatase PAP2 family protein n=1 Tax=Hymenobacter cyanobacteriorum TaxID=2926463 RepID=A0A9X1VJF3_9BACT|nr:phosphatase PAP2 family protein [Hymenobacter cyanobacteriorum]MCI1189763.1 phosphatase PAP2 family protein [Hymenobacter cyanobacteriorum]